MPHKYNAQRRHRIPKRRYKVTNWQAYEAGLRQRGSLTICPRTRWSQHGGRCLGPHRAVRRATWIWQSRRRWSWLKFALSRTWRQHLGHPPVLLPDPRLGKPDPGAHDGHRARLWLHAYGPRHVTQAIATISPMQGGGLSGRCEAAQDRGYRHGTNIFLAEYSPW